MTTEQIDPKEAAKRDAAMIEATLAEINAPVNPPAPKPVPKAKPARVKPAPVAVPDDFDGGDSDDWDALPERGGDAAGARPVATAPTPAPVAAPPLDPSEIVYLPSGFPDINADPGVRAAVANVARLEALRADAAKLVQESCAALGVNPQQKPGKANDAIERLIAAGGDVSEVERYDARCLNLSRIEGALRIAQAAVHPAREVALRRLLPAAQEALKTTFVAMHRERAEFARRVAAHQQAISLMRSAGFEPHNGANGFGVTSSVPVYGDERRGEFRALVARGILTADEAADLIAE